MAFDRCSIKDYLLTYLLPLSCQITRLRNQLKVKMSHVEAVLCIATQCGVLRSKTYDPLWITWRVLVSEHFRTHGRLRTFFQGEVKRSSRHRRQEQKTTSEASSWVRNGEGLSPPPGRGYPLPRRLGSLEERRGLKGLGHSFWLRWHIHYW